MTTALITFKYSDGNDAFSIFFRSDGQLVFDLFKKFCERVDQDTEIHKGRLNFHYFISNAFVFFSQEYNALRSSETLNNLMYISTSSNFDYIDHKYIIHPIAEKYSDFSIPVFESFNIEVVE